MPQTMSVEPISLVNETFALRDGERVEITDVRPTCGEWFCIMAVPVEMPEGEREPTRPTDGAPVDHGPFERGKWYYASVLF